MFRIPVKYGAFYFIDLAPGKQRQLNDTVQDQMEEKHGGIIT